MARILDQYGRPFRASEVQSRPRILVRPRGLQGRYDAAQTNDDNSRHWAAADALSADEANSYSVRLTLRKRSRYEVWNNSYARAVVLIFSHDVVGDNGPQLQMLLDDEGLNEQIEGRWAGWARRAHLARRLRTMRTARTVDGEGLMLLITNPALQDEVKLDLRLLECDRLHSPGLLLDDNNVDGVILDDQLNPVRYQILTNHPGGSAYAPLDTPKEYEARWVIHSFEGIRPEQHRGVPEMLSSLGVFGQLRRFILATLHAAETAADFSAVLETNAPPSGEAADIEAFDAVEIEQNLMVTMPDGWAMKQFQAQHPNTTFPDFKREELTEAGRALLMPANLSTGDSSRYNFASGKLDQEAYWKGIGVVQSELEDEAAEPIFDLWLQEARLAYGLEIPEKPRHEWLWQKRQSIDPREAGAEQTRLSCGALTLPTLYASRGQDWRTELEKGAKSLGITLPELQALIRQKLFATAAGPEPARSDGDPEAIEEVIHALRQ